MVASAMRTSSNPASFANVRRGWSPVSLGSSFCRIQVAMARRQISSATFTTTSRPYPLVSRSLGLPRRTYALTMPEAASTMTDAIARARTAELQPRHLWPLARSSRRVQ